MTPDQKPQPRRAGRGFRSLRAWLLSGCVAVLLLLMSAPLIAPYLIDSNTVKQRIQTAVAEKIGGRFDYQTIDFLLLPRPALEIHGIELGIPGRVTGTIDSLLVVPKLFPLLTGDLHLAALQLGSPRINLDLPGATTSPGAESQAMHGGPAKALLGLLAPLRGVSPTLKLMIDDGHLIVNQSSQLQLDLTGLTLRGGVLVIDPETAQVTLDASFADLTVQVHGHHDTIRNAKLEGSVKIARDAISLQLAHLALDEPALQLEGNLDLASQGRKSTLELHGTGIDVDATRRVALTLGSGSRVVANIFSYLRGGRIPKLRIHSQADAPVALGDLANLEIEGQLNSGAVSIPQIPLDLTEVDGDVLIADGILQGSNLSAHLEGSSGHNGTLKVGLARGNDLFQMRLTLNADLAQAHGILQRIVHDPDFDTLLSRISDVQGSGDALLTLGDSLARLKAQLEITEVNLTGRYLGVPLPIAITRGQLDFAGERIEIKSLDGSLGRSALNEVAGSIDWKRGLTLDLTCGTGLLQLDELYPWLAEQEILKPTLTKINSLTGRVSLENARVAGRADDAEAWRVAVTGSVQAAAISMPQLPGLLELPKGTFDLAEGTITIQDLEGRLLDTELTATGSLRGLPKSLDGLDLNLYGTVGQEGGAWLMRAFDWPAAYALRTPLALTNTRINWQVATGTTAVSGQATVADGPQLAFDVDTRPGRLMVNQLLVKDRYSDANLSVLQGDGGRHLEFNGTLQHQTLAALFVDPVVSQGEVSGEISVNAPPAGSAGVVAKGRLQGKKVLLPFDDHRIVVDQVDLEGEGHRVRVAATSIAWDNLTWQPLRGILEFDADSIDARISDTRFCGIDTPGQVILNGDELDLDLTLQGKQISVASTYSCLTNGLSRLTGTLDLTGRVKAHGEPSALLGSLAGPFKMTFTKGVIEQDKALARLLEVLNVTEIVKGRLPNLGTEGFAYNSITVQGTFQGGKLILEKLAMDGETLDILGHGQIDLAQHTVDVELLAAPFKTADSIIRHLPGINYLLAGTLVTIPVSVKGDLNDPKVTVLSPSAVGSSLLGFAERTLKAPVKLIETLLPGEKNQQGKQP